MSEYSLKPINIDKSSWFYDQPRGILVVHEARNKVGDYLQTDQFTISWAKIRAALKRHDSK
jgi:hypothetical protein